MASYNFIINHFAHGPYLWDTGWFSYATYRNGFALPNPPHFRGGYGRSLYTQHFYLLLGLASYLSYLFQTHYHWLAAVMGAIYSLFFVGPFLAMRSLYPGQETLVHALGSFGIALVFAFNGQVLASIGYPHWEAAISAFFILFLALHFLASSRLKWLCLLLGLMVREDAGLHYTGYFCIILIYEEISKTRILGRRCLLGMLTLCLTWSMAMLTVQRIVYPLESSMFMKYYVGHPPFSHVNAVEMQSRFEKFLRDSSHIYVPFLMILFTALVLRAPAFMMAYVACLPWSLLNLFAGLAPAARTLSLYYSFPLIVGMCWPVFGYRWGRAKNDNYARSAAYAGVMVAALGSTLMLYTVNPPSVLSLVQNMTQRASLPAALYERSSECLKREFLAHQKMFASFSVAAMFPYAVPGDRAIPTASRDADIFVFYANGMDMPHFEPVANDIGATVTYQLPALQIRVASKRPLQILECLAAEQLKTRT
jgi:hypothetical protein